MMVSSACTFTCLLFPIIRNFETGTVILMNTEVGVCVVLGVAGRWRKYRWINAHHHCRYNLLFPSLPRPALSVSLIPQGWQLRLPIVIRLPTAKGSVSRLYVCAVVTFSYWQTI